MSKLLGAGARTQAPTSKFQAPEKFQIPSNKVPDDAGKDVTGAVITDHSSVAEEHGCDSKPQIPSFKLPPK